MLFITVLNYHGNQRQHDDKVFLKLKKERKKKKCQVKKIIILSGEVITDVFMCGFLNKQDYNEKIITSYNLIVLILIT
jgi:hypothetical protein